MKPEFEMMFKKEGLTIFDEDTLPLFEAYFSWISMLFMSWGIKNKTRSVIYGT